MPQRPDEYRTALPARLRQRLWEIEAAILTRIQSDGAPIKAADPEYAESLRSAVPIALEYCLAGIERGEANPQPIPTALLSQARIAARNAVPIDTVLRRYFAGYTLLGDFAIEELEASGLRRSDLTCLLRGLSSSFDRLLAAVSEEYSREQASATHSSVRLRASQIQRLLAGEPLDASELGYDFDAHHLGAIAVGPGAAETLRELATALDCRLLTLEREEDTIWAWLGGRQRIDLEDLISHVRVSPPQARLAIGEPGEGLHGWRLTHKQASAAVPIALRSPEPLIRYADVALLALVLEDELLATSLRQIYLEPLDRESAWGDSLRETLDAYFAAERNVSSTAAILGVNRSTVENHLRTIESIIGRTPTTCTREFEIAIRLDKWARTAPAPDLSSS